MKLDGYLQQAQDAWCAHLAKPEIQQAFKFMGATQIDVDNFSRIWILAWLERAAREELTQLT